MDREFLRLPQGETKEGFRENFGKYIKSDGRNFRLTGLLDYKGDLIELPLRPYYEMGNERYGIYWYIKE